MNETRLKSIKKIFQKGLDNMTLQTYTQGTTGGNRPPDIMGGNMKITIEISGIDAVRQLRQTVIDHADDWRPGRDLVTEAEVRSVMRQIIGDAPAYEQGRADALSNTLGMVENLMCNNPTRELQRVWNASNNDFLAAIAPYALRTYCETNGFQTIDWVRGRVHRNAGTQKGARR